MHNSQLFSKKGVSSICKFCNVFAKPVVCELPLFLLVFLLICPTTIKALIAALMSSRQFGDIVPDMLVGLTISYLLTCITFLLYSKFVKVIVYSFVITLYAIYVFLWQVFSSNICPLYVLMIGEANIREASEFFNEYLTTHGAIVSYIYILVAIAIVFWGEVFFSRLKIKHKLKKKTLREWSGGLLLMTLLPGCCYGCSSYYSLFKCNTISDLEVWESKHELFPLDLITASVYSLQGPRVMAFDINSAISVTEGIMSENITSVNDSTIIVMVLGESYIKRHAGVYGYDLNTTPHLQAELNKGNLFLFSDVITPYTGTTEVEKCVFSCNSISDNERWHELPFFPAIFRKAGYDVYFWDNQRDFDSQALYTFTINAYLYNSSIKELSYSATNSRTFEYDQLLVDNFSKVGGESLVVLHLLGQHFEAEKRYPHPEYERFSSKDIVREDSYLTKEKKQKIAEYDNATFYNDAVMNSIFGKFRYENAVILYFSDHGEEIYDYWDSKGRVGVPDTPNKLKYQNEIPFMIWCSDMYMDAHPTVVERIKASLNKPFMIDNVCQILFYLAGISTAYYREERNLLSPNYSCGKRWVNNHVDYDSVMSNQAGIGQGLDEFK